jgi:hypothetical protein
MTTALGDELEAFILENGILRRAGADVEDDRVWMTCTCGAVTNRSADRD